MDPMKRNKAIRGLNEVGPHTMILYFSTGNTYINPLIFQYIGKVRVGQSKNSVI